MDIFAIRAWNLARYIDEHFDGNRTAFAAAMGKKAPQINGIFAKKNPRNLGEQLAREFERKLGLERGIWDCLPENATIAKPMKNVTPNAESTSDHIVTWECNDEIDHQEFILVPENTLCLSAGNGYTIETVEDALPHAFRRSYFERMHIKPNNAQIWGIRGNSMLGRLQDGDKVLVDSGRRIIQNDRIFAIVYRNDLFIKRIVKHADGTLTLRSDNADYQANDLTLNEEQLQEMDVIGQVMDLVAGSIL